MKGGIVGSPGVEDTRRAWPIESTKKGSWELTETEKTVMEPAWSYTRSSAYMLGLLALDVSGGLLTERVGCLWLFCLLLGPFPPTGLCCQGLCVPLSYCILPCHVWWMLLGSLLFSGGLGEWGRPKRAGSRKIGMKRGRGSFSHWLLYEKIINKN